MLVQGRHDNPSLILWRTPDYCQRLGLLSWTHSMDLGFVDLGHLWHCWRFEVFWIRGLCNTEVRWMLLCWCETWPVEDACLLPLFGQRYLRLVARVWWKFSANNEVMRIKVLGAGCASFGGLFKFSAKVAKSMICECLPSVCLIALCPRSMAR